jgi:hypothetical protein
MTTYNFTGRTLSFYDRDDTYIDDHKIWLANAYAKPILTLVPNGDALNVYSEFKSIFVNDISVPLQVYTDCDEFPQQKVDFNLFKDNFIVPSLWAQVARQLKIVPPQTKLFTVCNIVYYMRSSVGVQGLEVK